ncbi:LLM class flavin-dependent oxidoreductase [Actinacidiphila acididurans]|uniref:LLM class flavin-dependent oxidoreductase n=1 Tax=Actinacidiphila acididurans TaxID=2784346 RepID=A0ABS2TU91_9ACTN|nr:LLM class flavin-dependent oxidoreductase [Actinacidiphila acididurans]MBM9506566.1 LLM class flavin-dependent oxidoreductase [Actinacidiphila acididurans]
MTDYGHDLVFGTLLEPPGDNPRRVVELAEFTEEAGLDLASLSDHPYWPERLDTMALLSVIVARTTRLRVLSNLANLPLRPPTTLARTAATLDILSGGRFELGIGTGTQHFWDAITAEGGPRRTAGESIEALDEAVRIVRALWAPGSDLRFHGKHYRLDGAKTGPAPAHDIGIWLGAYQPRLLRLTGRVADAWVPSSPFLPPEHLPAANRVIDDAATAAGRSPQAVRRAYNVEGEFGTGTGFLQGPPRMWAEQLAHLALTEGISTFMLYRAEQPDAIRRFGKEVAPAVRELVAQGRGSGGANSPNR